MKQKEYADIVATLTRIRDSLAAGSELKKRLQGKYEDEHSAKKGLTEEQIQAVENLSGEIDKLWEDR